MSTINVGETPGALRNVGGSAGVPSSSSSLNLSPYAIGLPSVSGWDRTAAVSVPVWRVGLGVPANLRSWLTCRFPIEKYRGQRRPQMAAHAVSSAALRPHQ